MENDPQSGQRLLRAPFLKVQGEQGSKRGTDIENRHGGLCGKEREGGTDGERSMEKHIAMCQVNSQWGFAV